MSKRAESREQGAEYRKQGAESREQYSCLLTALFSLRTALSKPFFCFLLSALCSLFSFAQVTRSIPGNFSMFSADNLGNIYVVTQENQFKKFNVKGDSMGVFNDVRRYGKLGSINTSNPLRTVLFFRDFKTIIILDRLLNTVNTIDLRRLNILQVKTVAPAYDNNIWVFDEQESKLKKVSEDGRLLSETPDLRLVLDEAPLPQRMFDQNGYVYLYDPSKGIFIFDYYGALKNKIALLNWSDLQVLGNNIVGRKDGKILSYRTGSLDMKETVLPQNIMSSQNIQITPKGVYVLDNQGVGFFPFDQ